MTSTRSRQARPGLSMILLFLATAMCWIQTISANIAFTDFPANMTVKPGDIVNVTWRGAAADNGTVADLKPFTLFLRALTGQRYLVLSNVAQTAFTVQVPIPTNSTGGKHSFYADYATLPKGTSSNQFIISGPLVSTPASAPTSTPTNSTGSSSESGLSGAALGGIIGGVVVLLLVVALLFMCRHRRRAAAVADKNNDRSMDEHKEAGFTSGPGAYGSKKSQDKESLTRSAGSGGGPVDGGMMVGAPMLGARDGPGGGVGGGPRPSRPDDGSPRSQPMQLNHMQHSNGSNSSMNRSPFNGPDSMMPRLGGGSPRAPPQHQQYQPPQLPNHQQSSLPNPLMAGGRASPYNNNSNSRDSFESELESAYDPKRPSRIVGASQMRATPSPLNENGLSYSPSGSSRYPRNMTPQPLQQQQQQQNQNPFAQHDHEILAVAAAVAAAASPVQSNRQIQQQQQQDSRSMSPTVGRSNGSPRMKEIEMQPLDIHQHHIEQQQKMMQRQQQQQQRPVQQPMPAAQQSINPTQFDDKAEINDDEEDNVPVYNGYRDTIFGAYAQQQGDEDEEEEATPVVPALPVAIAAQVQSPIGTNASINQATAYVPAPGGAEIVRKKSVKFTGVTSKSGPVILPNHEAAKEHQAQRQQRQQQQGQEEDEVLHQDQQSQQPQLSQTQLQQHQQQQQAKQRRPVSAAAYTENGEEEDYDDEDYMEEDDEDDIKMRLMETESLANPNSMSINTTVAPVLGTPSPRMNAPPTNVLSPIQSPDQASASYSNAVYHEQHAESEGEEDDSDPVFGNGFYEDVLAAVERTVPPTVPVGLPSPTSSASSPKSPGPQLPGAVTSSSPSSLSQGYKKPVMPPMPPSSSTHASSTAPQQSVQQQYIPAPQPQHLEQQVFGAPSPRISPATLAAVTQQSNNKATYPSPSVSPAPYSIPGANAKPVLSPRSKDRVPAAMSGGASDDDVDDFYGGSLL